MEKVFRTLWWKLVGTPDLPPRFKLAPRLSIYTGKPLTLRSQIMAEQWLAGDTVDEIATKAVVTRERVRQCIWKEYRRSNCDK
jgi:DNA-binding transcriptional regulator YdaS (Cro superfamily)